MADGRDSASVHPLSAKRGGFFIALLALLLLLSCSLRLYGLDWDQGQRLHPDEVGIVTTALERVGWPPGTTLDALFDPIVSPLNPRADGAAYPYGALPLYLGKAVAWLVTAGDYQGILLTGRGMAAIFDTATALLLFLIASRLWGRWWGLFAAALYGLGILPVQLSHFYISEPFMAFFMAAALLCSLLYYQSNHGPVTIPNNENKGKSFGDTPNPIRREPLHLLFAEEGGHAPTLLLAGLSCGLAMSCKLSAAPVLALPIAAILLRHVTQEDNWRASYAKLARLVGLALAGAFAGLFIGDPYAILDAPTYLKQVADQAAIQSGAADVWFTRRYIGTWPVLYPLWQLVLLGVGPLVGIAGSLGAVVSIARARREPKYALLLVGFLAYFASIAFLEAKWVRYLLPLVPYVCLFATLAVMRLLEWRPIKHLNSIRWAIAGALLASAALGAAAFTAVYRQEHTAIEASLWLYSNVALGGKIATEINDGPLPLPLEGHPDPEKEYTITNLRMLADFTSPEASIYLRDGLRAADYLVVGSTRGARTVPAMPWRYPVQGQYYRLLFDGKLGFTPIYTAASYPSLLGITFPDDGDWVDASFIEYDHPTIRIFRKERDLTPQEWDALFAEAAKQPSVAARHAP